MTDFRTWLEIRRTAAAVVIAAGLALLMYGAFFTFKVFTNWANLPAAPGKWGPIYFAVGLGLATLGVLLQQLSPTGAHVPRSEPRTAQAPPPSTPRY